MSKPKRSSPELLSSGDVAEQAGVDVSLIPRWVKQRRIRPELVTAGGHYRFTQTEVDRVLKTPKAAGEQPPK